MIRKIKIFFKEIMERLIHIETRIVSIEKKLGIHDVDPENFHECQDQWWGGYTYAQHGDDLVVLNIFNNLGIQKWSYIDVGANHPYRISNTALLYERGYRGVNVEANPNLISLFDKYRPEDININVGVGASEGVLPFYMIDEYSGRNTFSKEAAEAFVEQYPEFKIREVKNIKIMTIEQIVDKYCDGHFPDFMSIDVEGLDYDILSGINFSISGPKVIDVEVESSLGEASDRVKDLLEKRGYFAYIRVGANVIFVKEEYKNNLI